MVIWVGIGWPPFFACYRILTQLLVFCPTEFLLAATFVPFMCVDATEIMDIPENGEGFEMDFAEIDKMMESFKKCFLHPVYVEFITKNLPKFAHKGLIDLE